MSASRQRPFYRGLGFRLFLVSLTLLAIPWAGYRYVVETESFLGIAQEQILLSRAEMVAGNLPVSAKSRLIQSNLPVRQTFANVFYAHPLEQQIQLDGYPDEWRQLFNQRRRFIASETNPNTAIFDLLIGFRDKSLYLLIQVIDPDPVYASSETDPHSGDHLLIALPGELQTPTRQYVLGTSAPGWIKAVQSNSEQPEPRIQGEWQESASGYNIELKLPLILAGGYLSLALVDRDTENPDETPSRAATSGLLRNTNLSLILMPDPEVQQILGQFDKHDARIRLLNRQGLIVGQQGRLSTDQRVNAEGIFRHWVDSMLFPEVSFQDKRHNLGRLDGPEIRSAMNGNPASYRYPDAQGRTILSAAYPVRHLGDTAGAIVVEQTTDAVLSIQQRALRRLLLISLGLFLFTGLTLLVFASRLTHRITRISHKIDHAVSDDGKIQKAFSPSSHDDEIGDMERNFASVMRRLQAYNRYLEAMAARLAHELKTPLTMVRSSLENLAQDASAEGRRRYLSRAAEGTQRLSLMLERMREATRLEQTLQMTEREAVDLTSLIGQMVDNYHSSYPNTRFACRTPDLPLSIYGAPELLVQALDKLVDNALEFHTPGSAILITLDVIPREACRVAVINQGPPLPDDMREQLFDSMVSFRDKTDANPHLGLGLYLVRLIAEYHEGRVSAENTQDGVRIAMLLPLMQRPPK
ncbi:MAG: ATP-binding protein [Gammaproteobacteria bacterium]|nr:ATP-binding protein [Gammaproteobacteria bacterium]